MTHSDHSPISYAHPAVSSQAWNWLGSVSGLQPPPIGHQTVRFCIPAPQVVLQVLQSTVLQSQFRATHVLARGKSALSTSVALTGQLRFKAGSTGHAQLFVRVSTPSPQSAEQSLLSLTVQVQFSQVAQDSSAAGAERPSVSHHDGSAAARPV